MKTKKEQTFANLKDIAKVFNVPQKRIAGWGILHKNDAPATPCIMIRKSLAVIDLLEGKLITTGDLGWRNITALPAVKVRRLAKSIEISTEKETVSVEKHALFSIYDARHFQDGSIYF